jgi:hypothetical protein
MRRPRPTRVVKGERERKREREKKSQKRYIR